MMNIKQNFFVAIATVISFVVFVTPILAQQDDLMAGRIAGEQAAKANTSGIMWMALGCIGPVGLIIALVYESSPSASQLLGKSPEYVAAYTDAYRETAKHVQTNKALTGCIVTCSAIAVYYVLLITLFATAVSTTDY